MSGNQNIRALTVTALLAMTAPAAAADTDTYTLLHASEPAIPDGFGRIYFYRSSSIMGFALQPTIKIDGVSTGGDSRPGDYFYIDRPAGSYEISTTTEKKESVTISVAAGQPSYVMTEVSMGFFVGHVTPYAIVPTAAQAAIADCEYRAPKATAIPATTSVAPTATAPETAAAPTTTTSAATAPATTAPSTASAASPVPTTTAPTAPQPTPALTQTPPATTP